mgnify:CR=1 FL=1
MFHFGCSNVKIERMRVSLKSHRVNVENFQMKCREKKLYRQIENYNLPLSDILSGTNLHLELTIKNTHVDLTCRYNMREM